MKIIALCALLGAFTMAGVPDAAADPATMFFVGVNTRGQETIAEHFPPANTATIVVRVEWKTLVGVHRQRLELIAPDGSLYQRLTTNIASSTGRVVVKTPVRVLGTWMTEYQMFGEWTVKVYLDDGTTPITSGHFILAN